MNWIKVIFNGLLAWLAPFIFNTLIFPDLPLSIKYLLYLLVACFAFVDYANNVMSGYLHKRNKITVAVGIAVGISWLVISFVMSTLYYVVYKDMDLLEFSVNLGSIYLMYPILGTLLGICEEKRGRRR
ncbi:MAG: hypothetical protein K9M99_04760 [Candidatus Cloacimonetes bacterium]|nr:hypothetical protein [Candidatus Cloacimonadota bacterium]